jgi:polyisoprenoid-binding protein YceI
MVSRVLVALALALLPGSAFGQVITWTIDPGHSSPQFSVRHMMIATVRGEFDGPTGTVAYDAANIPGTLAVSAVINAKSINTHNSDRDGDLKSPLFLDVAKFPTIKFVSTKTEAAGPGKYKVTGNLTIHGVTKPVVLDVEGPGPSVKDLDNLTRAAATMTTTLNRREFGLQYNVVLEAGGAVVADEVKVTIELEFTHK